MLTNDMYLILFLINKNRYGNKKLNNNMLMMCRLYQWFLTTGEIVDKYTELPNPKYYVRLQMAVARGLGLFAGQLTGHHTDAAPNTHSVISVQFPSRWSRTSTYICKAETFAFTDCDYCYTLVL